MSFIASDPHIWLGKVIGSGHCVALIQQATRVPHTSQWKAGDTVVGNAELTPGTAIATFDPDGTYGNHTDGRSHAAIFMGHESQGIRVVDQWQGRPTAPRIIATRHGRGPAVDDATRYHVIET